MPLTRNEVQAEKDQQRAEFALALRKVEIKAKSLQEGLTGQRADAAVHREKARLLADECAAQTVELEARDEYITNIKIELGERQSDIQFLETARSELENLVAHSAIEIEIRDKNIVELKIEADNRQIELAAKVSEQGRLSGRVSELNNLRKSSEEKLRHVTSEMRTARETSRTESKRLADFERKTERLMSQLSDREERLERREKELLRLKDSLKASVDEQNSVKRQLLASTLRYEKLERDSAKLPGQVVQLASSAVAENAMKKLEDEKAQLVAMVGQLTQEKDALVQKLKDATTSVDKHGADDAKLRSQVHELTAKVVSLIAETEGAKSPIPKLLQPVSEEGGNVQFIGQGRGDSDADTILPESLADRIKALQKSARGG